MKRTILNIFLMLMAVACSNSNKFTPGNNQQKDPEVEDKTEAPKPGGAASGYYAIVEEGVATNSGGNTITGVSKYEISVYSGSGKVVAMFYAVNKPKQDLAGLVGDYKITSYPGSVGQMDNGYVIDYGAYGKFSGGSYYVDNDGASRFISGGHIHIYATQDNDGQSLYSFRGVPLTCLTEDGQQTSGSVEIDYVKELTLGGQILKDEKIQSKKLFRGRSTEMQYSVYLPPSWDGEKKFPVIYMLHGMENQGPANNKWNTDGKFSSKLSTAIAIGSAPECVVIFPNCTVGSDNYFYMNGFIAGAYYMDYFFEELVPTVEEKYCIMGDRSKRMIGGLSMGGFGSLYFGSLHPEMFCYVYACSPAVGVWGSGPDLRKQFKDAKAAGNQPGLTIEIGTEDSLYQSAYQFSQGLKQDGVDHVFISRPGAHTWPFWAECADKIIVRAYSLFNN